MARKRLNIPGQELIRRDWDSEPGQKALSSEPGPYSQEVQDLDRIFDSPFAGLRLGRLGGTTYRISPEVGLWTVPGKPAPRAYFMWPLLSSREDPPGYFHLDFASDEEDKVRRLAISTKTGFITDLDRPAAEPDNAAITAMREAIKETDNLIDRRIETAKNGMLNTSLVGGGLAVAGAAVFGIFSGIAGIVHHQEVAHRHDREHRATYDKAHHQLPGRGFAATLGKVTISLMDSDRFKDIPSKHSHDNLLSPRRIAFDPSSCKDFKGFTPDETLYVAEKANDGLDDQPVLAYREADGSVEICSPDSFDTETYDSRDLAIQFRQTAEG